ncbi:MAG: acyl--CoA ligase [Rhodospirillaceae bacterium]|jgi:acyl-CoA synthetase (AMP-forming)/AMP-acid ligase II|nr:acyl--CoA ligase [Rhodospirillaceae bacterium]MBT4044728.1 acyl--CoA ligase [Rhodospirillaceae bacterium]MBT4687990.1 acyl--CoA ligase [Rhodospirillaceae bacterium]MBT5083496.1 acyl--CoA ligase [Rhodospirillaceae bacterium]MBT5527233.1 acyl--CoA ligase [Rhodospirillaceae bacterium]
MISAYNLGALYDPDLGGDNLALIDCRDWDNPTEYSHREIDDAANACARGLLARGLRRGDTVALLSANRAEFLISYLGILRAGMTATPISYKFPGELVDFVLADASVKHVFCDGARRNLFTADLPVTNFDAEGAESFDSLLEPGDFEAVRPDETDVAMVLYTSGSSGRPKGVPLTQHGHLWALRGRMANWPLNHHRLLIAAPLYHMNALCTCLFGHAASTSTVLLPEFDARHYLEAIARFKCTWITSVPTMLAMAFMEEDLLTSLDLSTVSIVRMGSAPVSPKLWARVEEIFPGASVMNGYGTTEAGPMVFGATGGKPVPPMSVGRKVAEVDVKLIDKDGNEADEGVCWQRTPANTLGYLNLPEKSAEVITEDGWYDSGDVFRRDEDGNYYFVGRDDDMFVCGGENIYPGEVEGVLVSHVGVEQSCVVPVPDDIKGEKPIAFVVRSFGSTVTEDEVKQHALTNAPAFQHPRMVIFMDELPLAGPGKIDRKGLETRGREIWHQAGN